MIGSVVNRDVALNLVGGDHSQLILSARQVTIPSCGPAIHVAQGKDFGVDLGGEKQRPVPEMGRASVWLSLGAFHDASDSRACCRAALSSSFVAFALRKLMTILAPLGALIVLT